MKINWNFQRGGGGGGVQTKLWEGYGYFLKQHTRKVLSLSEISGGGGGVEA